MIREVIELVRIEIPEENSGFYINVVKEGDEEPLVIFVGQDRHIYQKYNIPLRELQSLIEYATARLERKEENGQHE